ncbi:MAG TPA: hypothetical protein VMT73_11575, partial [Anaerolineales bacterium]|nr:hypothetical protein [Anaerolineales bacterium]
MKRRNILSILIVTLIIITACNLPNLSQQPTTAAQTAAAMTVQAVLTTPQNSPTAIPTEPISQSTPTLAVTSTPTATTFKVSDNTNCRKGPG